MIPLGRAAVSGRFRRVVGVTAAQSGKTETILDIIGERLDTRPKPIIYVGPSKEFNTDQFEPRLMGLLDEAATLARKVVRGRRMKKTLKIVAGVRVRLAHAGSSTALKSDPAALALVDEYDEMKANIKGQGDPLGLVEARGDTHADFVTLIVSTPSSGFLETEIDPVSELEFFKLGDEDEITSPIWRLFQEGTRHHFAWACPHCGEYFIPMMKYLRWPKDATPAQARRSAYVQCPYGCVDPILDEHKEQMNETGVMIAPGQTIEDAFADRNLPDTNTYSQWSSGLCSPFKTFGERAERLVEAEQSGEMDKRQTAVNAGFGELFAPIGGDVPEWEAIKALALPYKEHDIPDGVLVLTCGVDVQKNRLVYVVRGWGVRQESWLITRGQIYGPTEEDGVWVDLADMLATNFGGKHIIRTFIDAGFRPGKKDIVPEHRVYEFARRHSRTVYATKGFDTRPTPLSVNKIEVNPKGGGKTKYGLDLVRLSTDFFKSWVHERIRWPEGQPGGWHLFENIEEDFCRQIVSEARAKKPGGAGFTWVVKSKNNHFLDCEALAYAAAYMLGIQRVRDDTQPPAGTPNPPDNRTEPESRDDEGSPPAPPPRPAVARREGYLGGRRPGGYLGG
jgi:phage terminase large subunit GpA-like protein